MTDTDRIERIAAKLHEDHRTKARLVPLTGDLRPRDVAEGYAVQDALQARYIRDAKSLGGWKVALTTPVMQELVGVSHPCEGGIFADRIHHGTGEVRAADFVHIGVEAEIAVRLARDLPAGPAPHDRDTVADAVGACMAAIEIVDDRACEYGTLDGATLIADNSFNVGCVVGPEVTAWRGLDLATAAGRMTINGETVGQGHGRDVMGHPFEALAWLANSLAARGKPLAAGQVVLTGSVVATKWLSAGDEMASIIDGLGEARLRVG